MTTFAIKKVYTSKNGAPYTPAIGEWYTLTAEFDVTGTPKNAYGKIERLAIMAGEPTTDSWQKRLASTCRIEWGGGDQILQTKPVDGPTLYPVYLCMWRLRIVTAVAVTAAIGALAEACWRMKIYRGHDLGDVLFSEPVRDLEAHSPQVIGDNA